MMNEVDMVFWSYIPQNRLNLIQNKQVVILRTGIEMEEDGTTILYSEVLELPLYYPPDVVAKYTEAARKRLQESGDILAE